MQRRIAGTVLTISILGPGVSAAVCLDPKTDLSGYHIPLNEEIDSSPFIAIGKVVAENRLNDGPDGPDWIVATVYSVRIERVLKGRLPSSIKVRTENDSGRYVMDVGETHVLFLSPLPTKRGDGYLADSCGNSSALPKGESVVKVVQARVTRGKHAP